MDLEKAITFSREIPMSLRDLEAPIVAINPDYRRTDVEAPKHYAVKAALRS